MEEYERPWQVLPAKIIRLALEHAKKVTDFDQQIAFLLLDIGAETALKVYLTNKKQDIEKINFYDLIEKAKELALKDKIILNLDDVWHFHRVRNKLYHQGDGVKPTEDNLVRYSKLAPEILKLFIGVNLDEQTKRQKSSWRERPYRRSRPKMMHSSRKIHETRQKYITVTGHFEFDSTMRIDYLALALKIEFEYFQENCELIFGQLHPNCATRQFAIQYENILSKWPDPDPDTLSYSDRDPDTFLQFAKYRTEIQQQRLKTYNELLGRKATNSNLIDSLLEDVHHLYTALALEELIGSTNDEWKMSGKNI